VAARRNVSKPGAPAAESLDAGQLLGGSREHIKDVNEFASAASSSGIHWVGGGLSHVGGCSITRPGHLCANSSTNLGREQHGVRGGRAWQHGVPRRGVQRLEEPRDVGDGVRSRVGRARPHHRSAAVDRPRQRGGTQPGRGGRWDAGLRRWCLHRHLAAVTTGAVRDYPPA